MLVGDLDPERIVYRTGGGVAHLSMACNQATEACFRMEASVLHSDLKVCRVCIGDADLGSGGVERDRMRVAELDPEREVIRAPGSKVVHLRNCGSTGEVAAAVRAADAGQEFVCSMCTSIERGEERVSAELLSSLAPEDVGP